MFLSAASILAIFVVNTLEFIVNHFFSNRRLGNLESQRACCQLRFVAGLKLGTQAEQGREDRALPLEQEWWPGSLSGAVH